MTPPHRPEDDEAGDAHTRGDREPPDNGQLAEQLAELVQERGTRIACAESLTSGALASALGAAPGAGDWFRGGVVAYSSEVKHTLLRVPDGPVVSRESATAMAATTGELLGADLTVAVTGVGGPDPQDGQPVGTTWFAVATGDRVSAECQQFEGDPEEIVQATVRHGLLLLLGLVRR